MINHHDATIWLMHIRKYILYHNKGHTPFYAVQLTLLLTDNPFTTFALDIRGPYISSHPCLLNPNHWFPPVTVKTTQSFDCCGGPLGAKKRPPPRTSSVTLFALMTANHNQNNIQQADKDQLGEYVASLTVGKCLKQMFGEPSEGYFISELQGGMDRELCWGWPH